LSRFRPPKRDDPRIAFADDIWRFLQDPDKPLILALSRADRRKNIPTFVKAYRESGDLREAANFLILPKTVTTSKMGL
jgi:sucrose-phosphate synthase